MTTSPGGSARATRTPQMRSRARFSARSRVWAKPGRRMCFTPATVSAGARPGQLRETNVTEWPADAKSPALAFQSASSAPFHTARAADGLPEAALLAAPLMTAYLLMLGLRLAFELPAAIPANWIFRTILNPQEHETRGIVRRVMLAFLTPLVLMPYFALFLWLRSFPIAAFQTAYVLALSVCLIEFLLSGYRKIPFTCPMPGFRENLPLRCLLLLLGFIAFASLGAELELWMLVQPVSFLLLPAAMSAAWYGNEMRLKDAREAGELEVGLSFDSRLSPAVQQLKLFDSE